MRTAVFRRLESAYYLSEDTRARIQQRLERKIVVLGGPDFVADPAEVDAFYAQVRESLLRRESP